MPSPISAGVGPGVQMKMQRNSLSSNGVRGAETINKQLSVIWGGGKRFCDKATVIVIA